MNRSRKIIILSHCMLNANSKVEGLAIYKGAQNSLISFLIEEGYGIIQLPCPEITLYGIKRWGHVKEQFDTPYFREHCRNIFMPYLNQIMDYVKNGYQIHGLIGIDGSPSCGVNKTCSSTKWGGEVGEEFGINEKIKDLKIIQGKGVFIEEIENLLIQKGTNIKLLGLDEENLSSQNAIIEFLKKNVIYN
ncbi:hypothetical protein Q3V94_03030 [Caloramator sp. CAR-1]|uniref:CD3072 family TudS-related putative desulfidase n=1 Tax=Caloramator sp. CAR-1 TaxID=3062777 RepID=UPI0026E48A31|nr:CD3072 family TudS-related putative desulfidase [Caloramator sp. CAR-1]MDO6354059.1 hypothetical protein [Caloramator sp. CAR-1]